MPDFDCLYTAHECVMLEDAYQAITKCDRWDWLRFYIPREDRGFMLANDPELKEIEDAMEYTGHSGASYGWTMRVMHSIARAGGWDAYKASVVARWPKTRPVCECRAQQGLRLGWCCVAGGGVPGCEH